ncbi:hypothetical protein A4D02_17395 [Niastella koreensis]|uniref:Uncharacterized protein n=3 Tax=Niastella koreensis TaxID=354356 RepID=G8TD04_NIAKG|nr:hypothetical protein Niako_0834 [Niastella koreensis GR20-10]OQP39109.1 hypothetical protein A4D02_17395 [Niastella koreensis]
MQTKHNKQLGLYVILLDGGYDFLKWNKALVSFGYRIDIINLDEFELKFGSYFDLENTESLSQNIPIKFTDGGKRPVTIFISKEFEQKINTQFPQYIPFLEKGYVVLLKTFKKLPIYSRQEITSDELMDHMLTTYQFCKNFIGCVQLTVGDYFKPGGYFAHILEDTAPTKKDRGDKKIDLPVKIEVIKKGNFFKLDFS